jgi:hypothetical protein
LKGPNLFWLFRKLQPYFFIALTGMLAFAPVSFFIRSLKNDIIAIEYPVKFFISESIRNGEIPLWFNTWALGFPLQSSLTWGIFSTPQIFFSSLFNYNLYVLHIEFMFYVLVAGWGMYYLLKKHFVSDDRIALLLACSYMLSGFVTGSSQWLLYITAASFAPLVLHALLGLLKKPSYRYALMFAIFYFLMFTSVYQAFNIISTYCIIGVIVYWIIKAVRNREKLKKLLWFTGITVLLTFLFCAPCLYFTLEVLQYIERGDAISEKINFFNSNYLHPSALSSLLLPLSSTKLSFPGTEGTMMNSYMGLFVLTLLPLAFIHAVKVKNTGILILAAASILFLLVSFGGILPFRNMLNVLPGMAYFRNPGIFRFYFILFVILAAAMYLQNRKLEDLFNFKINGNSVLLKWTLVLLMGTFLTCLLLNAGAARIIFSSSVENTIKSISVSGTVFINSCLQFILVSVLLVLIRKNKFLFLPYVFAADLILNTLLCTPFFTVSSYSIAGTNKNFTVVKGFPVQSPAPSAVPASFTDVKNNSWYNINVFRKEVSTDKSYWGPLHLRHFSERLHDSALSNQIKGKALLFIHEQESNEADKIKIIIQKPSCITAEISISDEKEVILQQNYFPGWRAFYNKQEIPVFEKYHSFIAVKLPKRDGILEIRFEKRNAVYAAVILHLVVILFFIFLLAGFFRKFIRR